MPSGHSFPRGAFAVVVGAPLEAAATGSAERTGSAGGCPALPPRSPKNAAPPASSTASPTPSPISGPRELFAGATAGIPLAAIAAWVAGTVCATGFDVAALDAMGGHFRKAAEETRARLARLPSPGEMFDAIVAAR